MKTPPLATRVPQRLHPLAQAVAAAWVGWLALAPASAQTLPTGAQVVQGQASIVTQGSQMTVTNTAGAVLNWQSFSIGAGQSVRFVQPSASSQVLNRVTGRDPSLISGSLSSNGTVWLLNPYGVIFGRESRVDVAGLVASTLAISDADWRAQRFSLTGGQGAAALVNEGEIRTTTGGRVLLLGGSGGVRNEGLVEAPGGQVALAAGASIDLADSATPQLAVRVSAPAGQALNLGTLAAAGGRIDLQAAMVNQQGLVRADSLGAGPGGEIVLGASGTLELAAGSRTTADGARGGQVTLQAGTTLVAGTLGASGSQGQGGQLRLLGEQVGLLAGADVRADGAQGGGEVLVGGGAQGRDARVPNARAVYMDGDARISADATGRGDGGRVVLWSNEATRAYGSLSARGAGAGGNGGLIETSGGWLDARPRFVQADAPAGRPGQWLLDPNDLTIVNGSGDTGVTTGPNFTTTTDSATITTTTLIAALNAGTSVSVATGSGLPNTQAGDIMASGATINVAPPNAVTFSLVAHRHIDLLGATFISNGAPMSVLLSAGGGGSGAIQLSGSQITTAGGSISLSGPSTACGVAGCAPFAGAVAAPGSGRSVGVDISSSTLNAGTGTITVRGASTFDTQAASGVSLSSGSTLMADRIDLAGWVGAKGLFDQQGLYSAATLQAARLLALQGISRVSGTGGTSRTMAGVMLDSAGQLILQPSGAGTSPQVKIDAQSDAVSGSSSYALYFGAFGQFAGAATVDINADGASSLILTSSPLDLSDAGPFTIRGSSAFSLQSDINLPSGHPVVLKPSGGLTVQGFVSGLPSSLTVDTGSAALAISASVGSSGFSVGSAPVTLQGGSVDLNAFSGSASVSGGTIQVRAGTVKLGFGSGLSASGTGDAIVIAGNGGNVGTFDASGGFLSAPNGRWLIWATDPRDTANFNAGSLLRDFTQYGAAFGSATPIGTGNGVLFSVQPLVSLGGSFGTRPVKDYDGTTAVNVSTQGVALVPEVPGDVISGSYTLGSARFLTAQAGNDIPVLVGLVGDLPPVVDSAGKPVYGYRFDGSAKGLVGDIRPKVVTVSGVSAADKVYDGTRDVQLKAGGFNGLVGSETLTLVPGSATFDTADVGTGKVVTGTFGLGDGANGGKAANYQLAGNGTVTTNASITPRPVSVSGLSFADKVYDGTVAATLSGGTLTGLVPGQSLTLLTQGASFSTPDAGTGKTVTANVQIADGAGGRASNYALADGAGTGTATIEPKTLVLTGMSAADKVYDGSRSAAVTGGTLTGLVAGETLRLSGTGLFDTADAGSGKTVTVQPQLADGSGRAANYRLDTRTPVTTTATITPRPLTTSGLAVATRAYDGGTDATLTPGAQLSGLVAGESLTVRLVDGHFDTADAGSGKTVFGSLRLDDGAGGKASNYQLQGGMPALTGTVTPRELTVAAATAADKVYDGSTAASVTVGALQGLVGGQTLQASASGRFVDADAGTGKLVQIGIALGDGANGGRASNYVVAAGSVTATASITPRPLRVTGVRVLDKVYDGTTVATIEATGFDGIVAGQTLSLGTAARFDNANAGSGRAVSGSFTLADGASGRAANYTLVDAGSFSGSATITPRGLTVTGATAADKVYDASTTATVSGFTLGGVVGADSVAVSGGSGRFVDADVGTGKAVVATASGLSGASAANYVLAQASVGTRASITPATLTYVADPVSHPVQTVLPPLTGSVAGLAGSDTLASATTGVLSFTTTATASSPEGAYAVVGSGLSARNYLFVQAAGNATALTLVKPSTTTMASTTSNLPTVGTTLNQVVPPPATTSAAIGRSMDATTVLAASSSSAAATGSSTAFRTLDLDSRSRGEVAALLAARDQYKKGLFSDAIRELERNPTAADAPVCQTVEQAAAGNCLITEALKPALRERVLREQPGALPATAVAPAAAPAAPTAAPAAAPAVAPAVAAAPAAAPAVAAAAPARRPAARERDVELKLPAPRAVRSAALPQIQRKWALLIGTDAYDDLRIPQLDNAVADVTAVARVLEDKLGYQTVVVRNGSKAAMLRAFNQLAAVVSPADSVAIYYAGHGELIDKTGLGYWQPADADATRPETWLSNTDIGKLLGQLGASQVVLVSDSCFSGSLVGDERIRGAGATPDAAALLSRRAAVVMTSGGNEPVFDSGKNGHSTFAWSFMRAIEGVATWRPGSNVFEQVRFAVARQVPQKPQYGASRLGGHQPGADYVFELRQLESGAK